MQSESHRSEGDAVIVNADAPATTVQVLPAVWPVGDANVSSKPPTTVVTAGEVAMGKVPLKDASVDSFACQTTIGSDS
jgi:hypothetical protein